MSIQTSSDVDPDFQWGISSAAYQTEGAILADGKGLSIWDVFANLPGKTYQNQNANQACDFYHRYEEDLQIIRQLGIPNFRFSISWPRVLPDGIGKINESGLDFYDRLIDRCLELGISPWVTLYHWDLPQALEAQGGWTNRKIVDWFTEYVNLVVNRFKDRVSTWMVLNEPLVFTGAGYFLGVHAPGRRGLSNFMAATHHAALCQAEGGRIIRDLQPGAEIGTTFSCSYVEPAKDSAADRKAAQRVDAILNRLFIEPALGMGYPVADARVLNRIEKFMKPGDESRLPFDFDFIGLQNYTREVVRYSWSMPYIFARQVPPLQRNVPTTLMDWEVYPSAIYNILKQFQERYSLKKIVITENGAAFQDQLIQKKIMDTERVAYLQQHIEACLRAKKEGVPLSGYFVWTLTDNFEWAEGYRPTFGLVHVNFQNLKRTIKESGYYYSRTIKKYQQALQQDINT
ncbi:MAG: GH1 family beta-glucosidase [Cyclobacteriaceae bacterium]